MDTVFEGTTAFELKIGKESSPQAGHAVIVSKAFLVTSSNECCWPGSEAALQELNPQLEMVQQCLGSCQSL